MEAIFELCIIKLNLNVRMCETVCTRPSLRRPGYEATGNGWEKEHNYRVLHLLHPISLTPLAIWGQDRPYQALEATDSWSHRETCTLQWHVHAWACTIHVHTQVWVHVHVHVLGTYSTCTVLVTYLPVMLKLTMTWVYTVETSQWYQPFVPWVPGRVLYGPCTCSCGVSDWAHKAFLEAVSWP